MIFLLSEIETVNMKDDNYENCLLDMIDWF